MKIINGDNILELKKFPDNYFDSVVTDPPYGLGKEPDSKEMLKAWLEKGYLEINGGGFMGKEWDAFVPQPIFWSEVFRVLKPGGHVLSFFGTRTYDWGVMSMRLAGFEVRDCIQWLYGSGFPKSHNISKAIGKMYDKSITDSTDQAKQWDGWGSALKPANEPIVLARKPLEKGLSIAENVLKWRTGAINIDGCRVAFTDNVNMYAKQKTNNLSKIKFFDENRNDFENPIETYKKGGRFPANLILTHHPECEYIGTKKVKGTSSGNRNGEISNTNARSWKNSSINGIARIDYGSEEEVENWNCHEDCPIKILDEQSGELKSGDMKGQYNGFGRNEIYGKGGKTEAISYGDKGGASRFFYVAKASKSERNKGLDDFEEKEPQHDFGSGDIAIKRENRIHTKTKNFHPTVKPIKLMEYLVKLITPPNGIVLDPFFGSGTTGIACKISGFDFVGIEQDVEYFKIAEARVNNYTK